MIETENNLNFSSKLTWGFLTPLCRDGQRGTILETPPRIENWI